MLDTESIRSALRGEGRIGAKILERRPSEWCVSCISVAELRYEADQAGSPKLNALIETFIGGVEELPFDEECAKQFGIVAGELARRGVSIPPLDLLVAAHAVAVEATLVTPKSEQYSRVLGLNVENWL
jgi:tRNA(fMet)-specific endonuclease VapC